MTERLVQILISVAVAVVGLSGLLKIFAGFQQSSSLDAANALFSFASERETLLLAAVIELSVLWFVITRKDRVVQVSLLAWLSTVFLAYRIGLWWSGIHEGACHCLGNLTGWLGLTLETERILAKPVLAFLTCTSYTLLGYLMIKRRTESNFIAFKGKASSQIVRLIIIASSAFSSWGQASYTVHGEVHYRSIRTSYTEDYHFTVAVDGCDWGIEMKPQGNPLIADYSKSRWTRVVKHGAEILALTKNRSAYNGQDGVVLIVDDPVPPSEAPGFAQHIWLAYASGCYLRDATNKWIIPLGFLPRHYREKDFRTPARWECETKFPNLPIHIDYFFDIDAWEASADTTNPRFQPKNPVQSDTHQDILWSRYEAGPFQSWGGIFIPTSFKFTAYEAFAELASPGSRLAVFEVSGSTTEVTKDADPSAFSPVFDGVAVVDDYRHWKSTVPRSVNYMVTNSAPPESSSEGLLSLARDREAMEKRRLRGATRKRTQGQVIFSVLTLCVTACVGYLFITNKKKGKHQYNEYKRSAN